MQAFQNTATLVYIAPRLRRLDYCPSDAEFTTMKVLKEKVLRESQIHAKICKKLAKRATVHRQNDASQRLETLQSREESGKGAVDSKISYDFIFSQVKQSSSILKALEVVYKLARQSNLAPSTCPLFMVFFDIYLSSFSEETMMKYGDKIIPIAISCYRLAAKFNENQEDLWRDKVQVDS